MVRFQIKVGVTVDLAKVIYAVTFAIVAITKLITLL
jgi:hypothetical protein